jgi:MFS family permease
MAIFNGQVQKVNKSLKFSVLDGSAWAAMAGLTQNYITPFALALKATTAQIGLLTSFPNLLMAMSQLTAPALAEKAGSRKALILPMVFLHAVVWLPVLLVPYIMPGQKIWWLILFITVSTVAGAMANPAWGSMMADLVPERIRGRYFANRGRIIAVVTLVFSFIAAGILQITRSNTFFGFIFLFGGALVFRLVSFYFLTRQYELPQTSNTAQNERLIDVIKGLGSSNLGRFTIYIALVTFVTNMASPFFSVYMLRDLHFSYLSYVIITSIGSLTAPLFLPYWGRRADRAGNVRIIQITSMLIPFIPFLWLISKHIYILALAETFSQFAWAGFNLAAVNFVYDAANSGSRTQHIAVFNAMNGLAVCLGALSGGFMASRLPPMLGFSLLTLFVISGSLRAFVVAGFFRGFHEVRHVNSVGIGDLLLSRHRGHSHSLNKLHGYASPHAGITGKTIVVRDTGKQRPPGRRIDENRTK